MFRQDNSNLVVKFNRNKMNFCKIFLFKKQKKIVKIGLIKLKIKTKVKQFNMELTKITFRSEIK